MMEVDLPSPTVPTSGAQEAPTQRSEPPASPTRTSHSPGSQSRLIPGVPTKQVESPQVALTQSVHLGGRPNSPMVGSPTMNRWEMDCAPQRVNGLVVISDHTSEFNANDEFEPDYEDEEPYEASHATEEQA